MRVVDELDGTSPGKVDDTVSASGLKGRCLLRARFCCDYTRAGNRLDGLLLEEVAPLLLPEPKNY